MKRSLYLLILLFWAPFYPEIVAQNTSATTLQSVLDGLQPVSDTPVPVDSFNRRLVYQNTFSSPELIEWEHQLTGKDLQNREFRMRRPFEDAVWIAEGTGDIAIREGKLRVTSGKYVGDSISFATRSHMVVWSRKVLPENFLVEFTVNHCGSDNGLTLLFLCATGLQGEDIFDERMPLRKAQYPKYHSDRLRNYTVSYWSRNENPPFEAVSNRVRRNPGMLIIGSGHSQTDQSSNMDYHIRILKFGGRLDVEVNGKTIVRAMDPNPLGKGRLGFRSMEGIHEVTYDDLAVWELFAK